MQKETEELIERRQNKVIPLIEKYIREKRLIDIGCGNGLISFFINKKLKNEIVLLDKEDLREQKVKNFPFVKASVLNMPLENKSFDVSYVQFLFHHLPASAKLENILKEVKRISKEYIIIIEDVIDNGSDIKKIKEHDISMNKVFHPNQKMIIGRYYSDAELKKAFQQEGLTLIEEKVLKEGNVKKGIPQVRIYILKI